VKIIGIKEEITEMVSYLNYERPYLLAVRGVGKTFLIREVYKNIKVFA